MRVGFEDIVRAGDIYWFFLNRINALCALDIYRGDIRYISTIPGENFIQERLISKIVAWKNILYLIPMRTKKNAVYTYNIEDGNWDAIDIGEPSATQPYEKYGYANLYRNLLIMVGQYIPEVVLINIDNGDVKRIKICDSNDKLCFHRHCYLIEGKLYLPSAQSNIVYRYDVENNKVEQYSVGNFGNSYVGITYSNNKFWLSPYNKNSFVEWDGYLEYCNHDLPKEYDKYERNIFNGILKLGDTVLFGGLKGRKSFSYNTSQGKIEQVENQSYYMLTDLGEEQATLSIDGELKIKKNNREFKMMMIEEGDIIRQIRDRLPVEVFDMVTATVLREGDLMGLSDYLSIVLG